MQKTMTLVPHGCAVACSACGKFFPDSYPSVGEHCIKCGAKRRESRRKPKYMRTILIPKRVMKKWRESCS